MIRYLLTATCFFLHFLTFSQKVVFINSGEILATARAASDTGNYTAAASELLKIHERDTNYVQAQAQLAFAYLDGEQYEKAMETAEKVLSKPSSQKTYVMTVKGLAYNKLGQFEKSVEYFRKAIDQYPSEYQFHYHLGNIYYGHNDYDNARDCYLRALSISPFHSYSHLNLGALAMKFDHKVHAMMAYGVYLSLRETDNSRLVILDKFVTNQLTEETAPVPLQTPNAYEKLDQIIRAKIVTDKKFKSQFPVDLTLIHQFEMMFQKLDMNSGDENDPWLKFYLPIYKAIQSQNQIEPFVYHMLSSSTFDQVKKWRKKNEKVLDAYFNTLNGELYKKRLRPTLPARYPEGTRGWYTKSDLTAVGNVNGSDENIGHWNYFATNGELIAEGEYGKPDVKTGVWKYYDDIGNVKSIQNMDTGEVTTFFPDGTKRSHYFTKEGKAHGVVEIYHPCGTMSEKLNYDNGVITGKGETYYPSGQVMNKFTYEGGKRSGEYITYFETGQLKSNYLNKNGIAEGLYTEYFANGKVKATGNYREDELDGEWKYYHSNGQMERKGKFMKGVGVGEWQYFNTNGELTETRSFDAEGNFDGEVRYYYHKKLYAKSTFRKGLLVQMQSYDQNGRELGTFGNKDGNFQFRTFYPTGALRSEGTLRKGEYEGTLKYYYATGQLKSEGVYKAGTNQGPAADYLRNGVRSFVTTYKDGELDGYTQEFYANGKLKREGYYVKGKQEQQWLGYHADGALESDYYYLDGNLYSKNYDYSGSGKTQLSSEYDREGKITGLTSYSGSGRTRTNVSKADGRVIYEDRYMNKALAHRFAVLCGAYNGKVDKFLPDGTRYFSTTLVNGRREGKFSLYDFTGSVLSDGYYEQGEAQGLWKGYHLNGKIQYSGKYLDGESDSVWTYYYPSGEVYARYSYVEDSRDGITMIYAPDNSPVVEKDYVWGELVAYRAMTAAGTWSEWKKFTGDETITAFYKNGAKAYEEQYKNGSRNGYRRMYFSNGKICDEHLIVDGNFHGAFIESYSNGNPYQKGTFRDDEVQGRVDYFNPDGTLLKSEEFVNGIREGKMILYKNKVKVKEVEYFGGNPND